MKFIRVGLSTGMFIYISIMPAIHDPAYRQVYSALEATCGKLDGVWLSEVDLSYIHTGSHTFCKPLLTRCKLDCKL